VTEEGAPPAVPWEQVAAAASTLAAQARLADVAARFLALVESWAAPSAVLCAYRDPSAPEGVRMVAELTSGSVTPAAERSLGKLFTEYPADALTRPTLLGATEEAPGIKVRDTLVVPWSHGGSTSGFLVLRGLPRPHPSNLGDAVALLAQPLWPRVGSRAVSAGKGDATPDAIEARLGELGRLVEALQTGWRTSRSSADALRSRVEELQKTAESGADKERAAEAAGKAREQAESERDKARSEVSALSARVETAQHDLDVARSQAEGASSRADAAGKAREQAESELKTARSEVSELKTRVEALQRDLDAARSAGKTEAASVEAAAKAREQAESELKTARSEVTELKGRVEGLQRDLDAARSAGKSEAAGVEAAAKAREQAESERDAARSEVTDLKGRVETLQRDLDAARSAGTSDAASADSAAKAREQAESERDAARSEVTELKGRVEALQRDLDASRSGAAAAPPPVASPGIDPEKWQRSTEVFRSAFEAIRRTPFVPPTVRVWVGEAESLLEARPSAAERLGRVLLLDRDAPMLTGLAEELEQAGLDVLIAHHPDEVSLFLKTPDAQGLAALVLDVLALRPDQNVAELVRAWRRDLPDLALFVTFRADNSTESERAQRLPSTATAGYLPRPLQKTAILDAVAKLSRRATKR
jgi:predicted  nucleic acid-binding Zn-ribbon protein